MAIEKIKIGIGQTLKETVDQVNAAIEAANTSTTKSEEALSNSESTQDQLDQAVIDGDSSVEAAQARVDTDGTSHQTLKERLDTEHSGVSSQLAETTPEVFVERFPRLGGESDDTARIQRAVDSVSFISNVFSTATATAYPVIKFDKKQYNINSAINLSKHVLIGNETLIVGAGTHDCFYFDSAQRPTVEGFSFQGFDRNISFDTNNVAGAVVDIKNCNSWDSEVFIDSRSYVDSRSTVLNIENCFVHHSTKKAVISYCDLVNIDKCNFQHSTVGQSKMDFDSNVIIRDTLLVPYANEADMRWVDMMNSSDTTRRLTFSHTRLSGEGSGITGVYCKQWGNSASSNQISVILDNCQMSCGAGGPLNSGGVVVLADSSDGLNSVTPNNIIFKSSYRSASGYPFVKTESGLPVSPQTPLGFTIFIDKQTTGTGVVAGAIEESLEQYLNTESRHGEQKVNMTGGSYDINPIYGNIVVVSATAASDISNILNGVKGSVVYLANPNNNSYATVKHRAGGTGNIWINGAADRVIQPFETLTLIYTSVNDRWVLGEVN